MSLSKCTSTAETANTARLARLILGPCADVLRDILRKKIPPSELSKAMKQWSHDYEKNKKRIPFTAVNASQQQIVFPELLNQYKGDYSDLGITLLYDILRIVCKMPPPPKGWGKVPDSKDKSVAANIERISLLRNKYSGNSKDVSLSDSEFNKEWENILKIVVELEQHLGSSTVYRDSVTDIKTCFMEPEDAQKYIERLGAIDELRTKVYKVSVSIGGPKKKNDSNTGSSSKVIHSDALSQILKRSLQQIYLEKLEGSLQKTTINVEHSRGILVGCAEAGKTTLLKRLMGEIQDAVEDIESTRGLELHQHVFTIRNACLEVSSDNGRQNAFIKVSISDLDSDIGKNHGSVEVNANAVDVQLQKDNLYIQDNSTQNKTFHTEVENDKVMEIKPVVYSGARTTTIPKDTLLKILDEKEKLPTISMLDLAGQFAYYACHQIYITERVFFILVLSVNQKFGDHVSSEENNQQGSIFSTWTYKDYVKFWITSIKTFGSRKAPVLIIATHTEGTSEDEVDEYFKEFWKAVPEEDRDWLRGSLVDSEYEVDLLSLSDEGRETLESIKTSIIKAATQKLNNTIKVPSKWALLEQLIKEKKKEVMSFDEIWDINTKCLPFEFQLENKATLSEFLKFFHNNGLLLWFEDGNHFEDHSKQKVILDIQWFAIAVNKLIADKNHIHKDCKRRYYTEWDLFNKTGKLNDKLLTALWQDVPSYLNHKTEIMTKMEKLHMIVALHSKNDTIDTGKAWFVPCMNKGIFNQDFSQEKWEYTSILCFRFHSFAMFVYYRIVAYCMSYLEWDVTRENESYGLYQTASIFDYKNHTVIIGICENDIQVQLKRIRPSVIETNISIEIGEAMQTACKNLTETFDEKIYFHKGYKCHRIICNNEDRSFIPVSEIAYINRKGKIQCKFCSETHSINVEEILRFWEKDVHANTEGNTEGCCRDYNRSEGKKTRRTEPEYPFSKGVYPTDVMTSFIKVEVSKSVGLILVDGISLGTGFRVGEKYIMTCLHVIENIVKDQKYIECDRICVQFGKTKVAQTDEPRKKFRFEQTLHYMDKEFDVAILELKVHQESTVTFAPPLTSFGKMQYPSEIHLIGHTGCVQMKEDSQVYPNIIKPNNEVDIYTKWLSDWSRQNLPNGIDYYATLRDPPQKILFSTTFAPGSSGSPGFMIKQQKAYVVLIVRAGVPSCFYEDGVHVPANKRVEYGYALEAINAKMRSSTSENIKALASQLFGNTFEMS